MYFTFLFFCLKVESGYSFYFYIIMEEGDKIDKTLGGFYEKQGTSCRR